jgi:hypothetical protein
VRVGGGFKETGNTEQQKEREIGYITHKVNAKEQNQKEEMKG